MEVGPLTHTLLKMTATRAQFSIGISTGAIYTTKTTTYTFGHIHHAGQKT